MSSSYLLPSCSHLENLTSSLILSPLSGKTDFTGFADHGNGQLHKVQLVRSKRNFLKSLLKSVKRCFVFEPLNNTCHRPTSVLGKLSFIELNAKPKYPIEVLTSRIDFSLCTMKSQDL